MRFVFVMRVCCVIGCLVCVDVLFVLLVCVWRWCAIFVSVSVSVREFCVWFVWECGVFRCVVDCVFVVYLCVMCLCVGVCFVCREGVCGMWVCGICLCICCVILCLAGFVCVVFVCVV